MAWAKKVQHSRPRAVATAEVRMLVREFAAAAENALAAGIDGVELQAANETLIDQFLDVVACRGGPLAALPARLSKQVAANAETVSQKC